MAGFMPELETEYPMAMFPDPSTARLGMKRWFESGFHVPCWTGPPVTIFPPVTLSWYQRTLAMPLPFPTVWVSQIDSWPPRLRYCACIIRRYVSVSRLLPPCSGTVDGPTENVPMVTFEGPVKVELAGGLQSTS